MTPDKVATRPKPTKQQHRLMLGLINRQIQLMDEESEYFWKEHPFLEDPNAEKKIIEKPEWESEKALIKKKLMKVADEIDRLYKEMYPPQHYPEMHGAVEQQALIAGVEPVLHNVPKAEPKTVETMTAQELEAIFGGKSVKEEVIATTTAGAEILKQFQARVNRRRGY